MTLLTISSHPMHHLDLSIDVLSFSHTCACVLARKSIGVLSEEKKISHMIGK